MSLVYVHSHNLRAVMASDSTRTDSNAPAAKKSRTGKYCAVAECTGTHSDGISVHHFPADKHQRQKWIDFVRTCRANFGPQYSTPNENSYICERHFTSDDYPMSYSLCAEFNIERRRKALNPGAIPTIQKHEFSVGRKTCQSPSSGTRCRAVSTCAVATSLTATTTTTTTYKRPVVSALPGVSTVRGAYAKRERQRVIAELLAGSTKPSSPVTVNAEAQTEERERKVYKGRKVLAPEIVIVKPKASARENINTRSRQKDECCFAGCCKQRPKEGSVKKTFFPFPREDARCKQWIKNCGRQELMEQSPIQLRSQGFKICSDHFEDSQFQYSAGPTSQRLIPDAVPTHFKKSRRPGSNSSKPKETQKNSSVSSGGQLRRKMSTLLHPNSADEAHGRLTAPQNAEQLPEIKLEIDYAEDPALHWMTSQSVAEVPPEGRGDGETATTVQSLPAAGHIKVEPMDTHTDTVPVNTPPPHTDSEPLDIKTEPQDIKAEPLEPDIKTEPLDIRTEPLHDSTVNMRPEPLDIKAEPLDISTELLHVNTVPLNTRPKPLDIKPEPVYFEEPWAESGSTNPMPDNQTGSVVLSTDAHCDNQTGSLDSFTDAQSPVTDAPSLAEIEHSIRKEPVDSNGSLPLSRVFWSAI